MEHVVMYSGGIASWGAAHRVVERYGAAATTLLFTDTLAEDPDLHRFLEEGAAALGLSVTRLVEGRTPFEVFRDVRRLGNSQVAPCSRILKQEPARQWVEAHYPDPAGVTVYLGMDWTEGDRHVRAARNWEPYAMESPLASDHSTWDDELTREQITVMLHERRIDIPRLYLLGFRNNNCAGLCVRGGIGHWRKVLNVAPKQYAWAEAEEEKLRNLLGNVAILADRSRPDDESLIRQVPVYRDDGSLKGHREEWTRQPLPLRELRRREKESRGDQMALLEDDWLDESCSCFGSWEDEDEVGLSVVGELVTI